MRIFFVSVLFCLFPLLNFATTISCSNADYSGKELLFYKLSDPISGEKEPAFTLTFDLAGKASATIKHQQTLYAFSEFGVYKGMLTIEPDKSITLKLPPLREKSFANQKNPYFTPVAFWFVTESANQLTDKISSFEQDLNLLTDKYFNQLYFQQNKTIYDSLTLQLYTKYPETSPKAFVLHKNLKTELVRADIFRLRPVDYSKIFNEIQPEFWTHEAFVTLFEKTFEGQLSFSAKAIKGKEVNAAVEKQDVNALLSFTKTKYKVSGKMAELVLLKLLHDGFYSGEFSQTTIANMVSSSLFTNNSNPLIKTAAKNVAAKFSFLQKGSLAPEICLTDLKGAKHCTNSDQTKFKYIVFADVETVVCQEHLKYLSRINELFNKHLDIFVVLRDTDKKGIETFMEANKLPGVQVVDSKNRYIEKYKIRSFPQCFLLNEKHEITFTNTNAPLDGFEQQFGTYLRNELFMRQRNQSQ
ncbi:redoxin domain-containing protein [uncultured Draconibacterium sp.]|uniref:peroxiredoxin family protein n=1 Tax=uncultured Draconibacterium sp. TaxID=1573823 RepID=UPI0032165FC8